MPDQTVQVEGPLARPADEVWEVLRDFGRPWHPWIAAMTTERGRNGALVRAFTVAGEGGTYREQLTYFSDSDRVLGYAHLAGIQDCEAYDARVGVTPINGGCQVNWTATVRAPEPRLQAICDGTRSVFAAGIAALMTAPAVPRTEPDTYPAKVVVRGLTLQGAPRLALTVTPDLGDDRLCLFLHGIGGAGQNWLDQLQAAGQVMRAAALDLRGYGGSALGPGQSTVDGYCADILRVAKELGARRLVLVGLSYGSWIATSFAMRHPDMLDGLVLSGGCTGMSEAGPQEREAFRASREIPLNAGQTPADFAPNVVKVLAGPNANETIRERLFDSMAAIPSATYRDAVMCFTNPPERFDFARLTMPVLMMTGEHDRLAPPDEIRGVAGKIHASAPRPDVRFEVIKDAGHVCNVEQPAAYNRHLIAFLRRLP